MSQDNKNPGAPTVSVVLVAYNHQDFIAESVKSILHQSHTDLELVVVDSGSSDRTPQILGELKEARLTVITTENRGPGHAFNLGISRTRGKYIAILSGDDIAYPTRVEKQLAAIKSRGVDAVASHVTFINDSGQTIEPPRYLAYLREAFGTENMPRPELLERLLRDGNFLNITTLLVSRAAIEKISRGESRPFHPYLLQLQDYDFWIRLVTEHSLWVIPEALMKYRIRSAAANLSAPTKSAVRRTRTESFLLLADYLRNLPEMAVGEREKLLSALMKSPETSHRLAAIQYRFSQAPAVAELDFAKWLGEVRIFDTLPPVGRLKKMKYMLGRFYGEIRGHQ